MIPERRDLKFQLPAERLGDWHPAGPQVSHFFNAMSLFFPDGERFFIDSVRHFQDQIDDPEQRQAVRGFIGQEAMHGREHEIYNQMLDERGLPAQRYVRLSQRGLALLRRFAPARYQLAATIALEHLTAIMAEGLLEDHRGLQGAEPHYAAIWTWHALEETEHKAVAYDVYQQVAGGGLMGYLRRCFALIEESFFFWLLVTVAHLALLRADGQLGNWRGWWRCLVFLWGKPGVLRRQMPAWFSYFRPGFHPWQRDNRHHLQQLPQLEQTVAGFESGVQS